MLLVLLNCLTESTFPSQFNPHISKFLQILGGGGGGGGGVRKIPGPPPLSMKPGMNPECPTWSLKYVCSS